MTTSSSERLEQWLLALDRNASLDRIGPDVDLIDEGILDSLEFINLLLFVEELRGQPIRSSEIRLEAFRTLRTIQHTYIGAEERCSA